MTLAVAKSAAAKFWKVFVNPPITAPIPINGPRSGAAAAVKVAKPPAAAFAPVPVAANPAGNTFRLPVVALSFPLVPL